MPDRSYAVIEKVDDTLLLEAGVELSVLRLDNFMPPMSGNKFFKLKNNIEFAKASGYKRLLSFGGAFSNHIHALACAGRYYEIDTIGIIRGDKTERLNPTLQDAVDAGMTLRFINRTQYRNKEDPVFIKSLQQEFPDAFIIPEGGSNLLGVEGCTEIVQHVTENIGDDYDVLIMPCGTGATLAGVSASPALSTDKRVVGFSVLKNAHYLNAEVRCFHGEMGFSGKENWHIEHDFHCGGYAKINKPLVDFINSFSLKSGIEIEPIYTGKMFYGLYELLKRSSCRTGFSKMVSPSTELFKPGCRIVAIHTGGLQGLRGMSSKLNVLTSNLIAG